MSCVWTFHEQKEVNCNLRMMNLCKLPETWTINFGVESPSFRGKHLWNSVEGKIKRSPFIAALKITIKNLTGEKCSCKI